VITIALWNVFHRGKLLVGPDSEFPKKQSKSKTGERYHELDDLRLLQTYSPPVYNFMEWIVKFISLSSPDNERVWRLFHRCPFKPDFCQTPVNRYEKKLEDAHE
jgi:hypothetical protein